jgi:hypothetical protein
MPIIVSYIICLITYNCNRLLRHDEMLFVYFLKQSPYVYPGGIRSPLRSRRRRYQSSTPPGGQRPGPGTHFGKTAIRSETYSGKFDQLAWSIQLLG